MLGVAFALLMQAPAACDSIVAAARVDSVLAGIFVTARSADVELAPDRARRIALNIGAAFTAPRPLKLSVFGAAPALRMLRSASDTAPSLRAPDITGVYEVTSTWGKAAPDIRVLRVSLISGFDSAATEAIRSAAMTAGLFMPVDGQPTARTLIRFATDSIAGATRIISGYFPRMPVIDATPRPDNPALVFPDSALAYGLEYGTVVLRFIVGRDGVPEPGTTEVVRAEHAVFLRAAIDALKAQRFRPATIHGCAVTQVVDYSMSFFPPAAPRH